MPPPKFRRCPNFIGSVSPSALFAHTPRAPFLTVRPESNAGNTNTITSVEFGSRKPPWKFHSPDYRQPTGPRAYQPPSPDPTRGRAEGAFFVSDFSRPSKRTHPRRRRGRRAADDRPSPSCVRAGESAHAVVAVRECRPPLKTSTRIRGENAFSRMYICM